jgi:uncharacterized protein (DUF2164 family)
MGLMDKMKAQAEQAVSKAQHGVQQGQSKVNAMQAQRQLDHLLRELGAAYYAAQRQAGPQQAVDDALAAVDAHGQANGGTVDVHSSPPDTPAGDFTLG